jgi:hypothetical protein
MIDGSASIVDIHKCRDRDDVCACGFDCTAYNFEICTRLDSPDIIITTNEMSGSVYRITEIDRLPEQ